MPRLPSIITLVAMSLASRDAAAQGSRFPAPRIDLGGEVYDSVVVDIDQDGCADLIAGAAGLRVRRGLGDGTFGALETYVGGTTPQGLTIIDMDLDGDLDVVACRAATGSGPKDLIVVKQKADQTFGPATPYSAITWPTETAAGDLNDDGWPDAVVTSTNINVTASQAQVRLGTGAGNLGAAVTVSLGLGAGDVALADLDADGDLDLAAEASAAAAVSVRLGDGAGGFGELTNVPTAGDSRSLTVADLDVDGALDFVVGLDDLAGEFDILYGHGDGTFESFVPIDSGFIYPRESAVADIDRDGLPDLALTTGYRVSLLFNLGGRQYAEPVHESVGAVSHSAIALSDLDLDGWLDLVTDNASASDATMLRAEGGGDFESMDLYDGPSTFYPGPAIADLDGDGRADIFASNEWTDTGTTWLSQGDGTFVAGPTFPVPDMPWGSAAGPLDGDGVVDLLLLDRTTSTANVYIGLGDGSFAAGQVLSTGGEWPRESVLADFDHDGDLDAAVANETPKTVRILEGGGDGTFSDGALLGPFDGNNLRHVASGDISADGHEDLAVGLFTNGNWRVLVGDGSGGFSAGVLLPAGESVSDIQLADMNTDGRLDAIVPDYSGNALYVFLGTDNPSFDFFEPFTTYALNPTDGGPAMLALADYDVDGTMDIAVGMGGAQRVDLLFGDGDGAFTLSESYSVDETGSFIYAGDWNQDGAVDLAAVAQSVSILLNTTLASWEVLGQGKPGSDGIPWLHGEGLTSAGQPIDIGIEHALPFAPLMLVVGLTELGLSFKGGVLVPAPDLLLAGLTSDAAGELSLAGAWPDIPSGLSIYLQAWLLDASALAGLSATGALRGTGY